MKKIKKKLIKNLNLSFDELISTDKQREISLQNSFLVFCEARKKSNLINTHKKIVSKKASKKDKKTTAKPKRWDLADSFPR